MPLADPTGLITLAARAKRRLKPLSWLLKTKNVTSHLKEIAEETAKDNVL